MIKNFQYKSKKEQSAGVKMLKYIVFAATITAATAIFWKDCGKLCFGVCNFNFDNLQVILIVFIMVFNIEKTTLECI